MPTSHENFTGQFGSLTFSLDVMESDAHDIGGIRQLLLDIQGGKAGGRCGVIVVVRDASGQTINGRAGRRCGQVILSRILRGDELPLTYEGGWMSNGWVWGPTGDAESCF